MTGGQMTGIGFVTGNGDGHEPFAVKLAEHVHDVIGHGPGRFKGLSGNHLNLSGIYHHAEICQEVQSQSCCQKEQKRLPHDFQNLCGPGSKIFSFGSGKSAILRQGLPRKGAFGILSRGSHDRNTQYLKRK